MRGVIIHILSLGAALSLQLSGAARHATKFSPVTMMCAAPALMPAEIEAMAYRDLQAACKERGLGAKGKTAELRERLLGLAADGGGSSSSSSSSSSAPGTLVCQWATHTCLGCGVAFPC